MQRLLLALREYPHIKGSAAYRALLRKRFRLKMTQEQDAYGTVETISWFSDRQHSIYLPNKAASGDTWDEHLQPELGLRLPLSLVSQGCVLGRSQIRGLKGTHRNGGDSLVNGDVSHSSRRFCSTCAAHVCRPGVKNCVCTHSFVCQRRRERFAWTTVT